MNRLDSKQNNRFNTLCFFTVLFLTILFAGCTKKNPSSVITPSPSVSVEDDLSPSPAGQSVTPGPTIIPSETSAPESPAVTPTSPIVEQVNTPEYAPSATPTPVPANENVYEIHITTENNAPIESKTEYINASMEIDGESYSLRIKGRGNSSWTTFPKKSYRIKLDNKASLLGMSKDKDFVFSSNYVDPSLIRNAVTYDMAKVMTNLSWNPDYRFCELYINDEYLGIYVLSEKIEDSKEKLNLGEPEYNEKGKITDGGFLLEWGWDYDGENIYGKDYFMSTSRDSIYVKEPDVEETWAPGFRYAYDYYKACESCVENVGDYTQYIDVDSWVDWFIINELTNNTECAFYRSLYMYKQKGGKLCLGPLWDYDTAFGNHTIDLPNYDGWVSVDSTYVYMQKPDMIYYLLLDENFCSEIKKRWAEVKEDLLNAALNSINKRSAQLSEYIDKNFERWPKVLSGSRIGSGRSTTYGFTTYEEHIDYMRSFIQSRYDWMDSKLTSDEPLTTPKPSPTPEPAAEPSPEPVAKPSPEPGFGE